MPRQDELQSSDGDGDGDPRTEFNTGNCSPAMGNEDDDDDDDDVVEGTPAGE